MIEMPNTYSPFSETAESVFAEMARQDVLHPTSFPPTPVGIRLAFAAAKDEWAETWEAWRAERRAGGWPTTHLEARQCTAVLLRAVLRMRLWEEERTGALFSGEEHIRATSRLRRELHSDLAAGMADFLLGEAPWMGAPGRDDVRWLLDVAEERIMTAQAVRDRDVEGARFEWGAGLAGRSYGWALTAEVCFGAAVAMGFLTHVTAAPTPAEQLPLSGVSS